MIPAGVKVFGANDTMSRITHAYDYDYIDNMVSGASYRTYMYVGSHMRMRHDKSYGVCSTL